MVPDDVFDDEEE